MEKPPVSKFILDHLGAAIQRDDLIRDICYREAVSWPEAEALVNEVEETNPREILRRQSPILITSSLMAALTVLLITVLAVIRIFMPAIWQGFFSQTGTLFILVAGYAYDLFLILGLSLLIGGLTGIFNLFFQFTER